MDVRINNLTSTVHAGDVGDLLQPEVLEAIVRAVLARLLDQQRTERQREADLRIDRRAIELDRGT